MPFVAVRRKKFKLRRPKGKKKPPPSASSTASPPWIELPVDVTANILQRLGPVDILISAQEVCTTWWKVCKDPAIWRVIDMGDQGRDKDYSYELGEICVRAIERSKGQLIDINIEYFGTDDLLRYVWNTSKNLRRLRIGCCNLISSTGLREAAENLLELEELHLFFMSSVEPTDIERIGTSCPKLKSFTFNSRAYRFPLVEVDNHYGMAVASGMPNLCHLQFFGNKMNNEGLNAILDGCPRLKSLDLRQCFNVSLNRDIAKRCSEQLNVFKSPCDSTDDYEWDSEIYDQELSDYSDYSFYGGYDDYEYYKDCLFDDANDGTIGIDWFPGFNDF